MAKDKVHEELEHGGLAHDAIEPPPSLRFVCSPTENDSCGWTPGEGQGADVTSKYDALRIGAENGRTAFEEGDQSKGCPKCAERTADNALGETIIGLFKAELIDRRGPWRTFDAVDYATLEWVDWFNRHRLLEPLGYLPPTEFETLYYRREHPAEVVGLM